MGLANERDRTNEEAMEASPVKQEPNDSERHGLRDVGPQFRFGLLNYQSSERLRCMLLAAFEERASCFFFKGDGTEM